MSTKNRKLRLPHKIAVNIRDKWEKILSDVDKPEVPIQVLERMIIKLIDGSRINIDIMALIAEGGDPSDIEEHLQNRLTDLENVIEDIDFFVNIDMVVKTVQPKTDQLLGRL